MIRCEFQISLYKKNLICFPGLPAAPDGFPGLRPSGIAGCNCMLYTNLGAGAPAAAAAAACLTFVVCRPV